MKKLLTGLSLAAVLSLAAICSANAQNASAKVVTSCGAETLPLVPGTSPLRVDATGKLCTAASVSATVGGFTPGLTFATLTATASSASVALPAGATVFFQNNGTTTVSCTLGVGSATALANEILIPASSGVPLVVGSNTFGACIDQAGSASNLVVLAGGSGLGNAFGGGGGSGGGGAITAASGSYASGAFSSGSVASGAYASGAFASGSVASGAMVDLGSQADAAAAADNSTASLIALLKRTNQNVTTLNTTAGAATPAGTNIIGKVTTDQTTHGTTDLVAADITKIAGVATVADPCQTATKVYTPINIVTAANTKIVAGTAAKKTYICALMLYPGAADNIAIIEGSGTNCATSPLGLIGGATAATGIIATAQAGFVIGTGQNAIAASTVAANDFCLITSAAVQLSGVAITVSQ